jgi:hypothetical protein
MSAVGSFNTQEVHLWNNPQERTSKVIQFPKAYVAPPRVPCGLTSMDIKEGTNVRVRAYNNDINNREFKANIDTWADTVLYSASVDYLIAKPGDVDIQTGEFSTQDDHSWDKPQLQTSRRINFERPFVTPPKVLSYLREIDCGEGASSRVRTYVDKIDAKGFTIHIDTWADTKLFSGIAGWIAYPEDKEHIYSGVANTMDVRPWDQPQERQHKDISFQGVSFWRRPSVFCALNSIDISTEKNLRVRCYTDNVSQGGMTWHIDSWADTKLWSAGISYIAFN